MRTFFAFLLVALVGQVHSAGDTLRSYRVNDFFRPLPELDQHVEEVFLRLSDEQRVAQMIMPAAGKLGKSTAHVQRLIREGKIGGAILLNGTKTEFTNFSRQFDSVSVANGHPRLLYSADAELSLINMKIKETQKVKYANKIRSFDVLRKETEKICAELNAMGVQWNFAPVVDLSPNSTVSFRSFGLNKDTIIQFSNEFIRISQARNIIATAKHFPGHGYVVGDTHKQLVFIDGEMKEVDVYKPLIRDSVLSIMIGHIAVKNNKKYDTDGLPSTVSRKIVTGLLREEMGFRGLIVTDAMGMGGVVNVPQSGLKAAKAGCDVILMPRDEDAVHADILAEIKKDEVFRDQVYESVKRIIRIKIILGILS
ncbi:MAG: glycoside hydrolase family 3 N-terminal domain-containing protein [Flavobacteriales bacterium]